MWLIWEGGSGSIILSLNGFISVDVETASYDKIFTICCDNRKQQWSQDSAEIFIGGKIPTW